MPWISIAASVAGSVVSGAMSKKSSGEAAGVQSAAAGDAIGELERQFNISRQDAERMYALTRQDQAPFRDIGVAANKRLSTLLGLEPGRSTARNAEMPSGPSANPTALTPDGSDPVWDEIVGAYQAHHQATHGRQNTTGWEDDPNTYQQLLQAYRTRKQEADAKAEAAAEAEYQSELAASRGDPAYGSLLKRFGAEDLNSDVVYNSGLQFGLNEGRDAINARAIAGGGYDSGATLKALTKFGNDYGETKAEGAYGRFMNDKSSTYGMLSGQQNVGQNATNAISNAGANMVSSNANLAANNSRSIADLITQGGNARAAGIVAGGNAWGGVSNSLTSGINNYQSNKTLEALLKRGGSGGYSPPTSTAWQMFD